jgi:hypothetical protein
VRWTVARAPDSSPGQIGVAASVVLFIIDLRQDSAPENIPYDPRRFEVGRSRDGGLSLRVNVAF